MTFFAPPKVSLAVETALNPTSAASLKATPSKPETERRRAASWAGWVRNVLPSQRPERGGTLRNHGFWESVESAGSRRSRRQRSSSHQVSRQRLRRMGSDQIVRWNTAKELSQRWTKSPDDKHRLKIPEITLNDVERWSWAALSKSVRADHPGTPSDDDVSFDAQETTPRSQRIDSVATSVIDRRLSHAQRLVKAKEEAHRQRRSLKESGDYLGVQGFNPETGELDIITPTESEESAPLSKHFEQPLQQPQDERHRRHLALGQLEREAKKAHLAIQQGKLRRYNTEKEQLRAANLPLKWRRETKQWSSAHEPALSTITQPQPSMSSSDTGEFTNPVALDGQDLVTVDESLTSHGELVDITSPPPTTTRWNLWKGDDDNRGSDGTVVHTPHRVSLADLSPSALELFENGISFDHSSNSGTNGASGNCDQRWRLSNSPDAISPTSQVMEGREPQVARSHKVSDKSSPPPESFLGQKESVVADPGGRVGNPAKILYSKIDEGRVRRLPTKKDIRQLFRKSPPSAVPKTLFTEGTASQVQDSRQVEQTRGREHCAMPHTRTKSHRLPILGNLDSENTLSHLKENRFPVTPSSTTNLQSYRSVNTVKEMAKNREAPCSSQSIQNDMSTLRERLGRLKHASVKAPADSTSLCDTDHKWSEDTIPDITRKGMEAAGESACITTTTTTGCVQTEPHSVQKKDHGQKLDLPNQNTKDRHQLTYTTPATRSSCITKEDCPENTKLNALVTRPHTRHRTEPGTTSTSHLANTKQRVKSLVTESTVPARHTKESQGIQQVEERAKDRDCKPTEPKPVMADRQQPITNALCVSTIQPRTLRAKVNSNAGHIPGSYPAHSDGKGATGDRSSESVALVPTTLCHHVMRHEPHKIEANSVFHASWKKAVFLMKLYWKLVGPVFDPQSVYWQRQARHEATVVDSVVLVMAVPGAILATAVVIWAMRLAAATGVYVGDVVGSVGGNMLYLYDG